MGWKNKFDSLLGLISDFHEVKECDLWRLKIDAQIQVGQGKSLHLIVWREMDVLISSEKLHPVLLEGRGSVCPVQLCIVSETLQQAGAHSCMQ